MDTFNNLLWTVGILVVLAVAYVSFWVLVALFVSFVVYQVIKITREE